MEISIIPLCGTALDLGRALGGVLLWEVELPDLRKLLIFAWPLAANQDALVAIEQSRARASEWQLADQTSVIRVADCVSLVQLPEDKIAIS